MNHVKKERKKETFNLPIWLVPNWTSTVDFSLSKDIALAGQTISQGLEQSEGQFSGSNSNNRVLRLAEMKWRNDHQIFKKGMEIYRLYGNEDPHHR